MAQVYNLSITESGQDLSLCKRSLGYVLYRLLVLMKTCHGPVCVLIVHVIRFEII